MHSLRMPVAVVLAILLAACTGVTATRLPSSAAVPSASAVVARPLRAGCSEEEPCVLSAGTWTLTGPGSFIAGLEITVPAGWSSVSQNAGEFKLISADHPDNWLFMWRDVSAIRNDFTGQVVPGVPSTPEGLTAYFRGDPDLTVSVPVATMIAGDVAAVTYTVAVSASATSPDKGCPQPPHCVDFLRDVAHWGSDANGPEVYGIGAPEVVRLYLATIGTSPNTHLLVIALDSPDMAQLATFTSVAEPIIASINLSATIPGGG
jgi:hypothetical protein